jgi:hypothetical protein
MIAQKADQDEEERKRRNRIVPKIRPFVANSFPAETLSLSLRQPEALRFGLPFFASARPLSSEL